MNRPWFHSNRTAAVTKAAAATLALGLLVLGGASRALAHSDPPLCSATGVALFFSVFEADGLTPATIAMPGDTLFYQATLGHAGGPQCNYDGGILTITTPDGNVTDVTPVLGIPLVQAGSPFVSVQVPYLVQCEFELQALAAYANGMSHFGPDDVTPLGAVAPITTPVDVIDCEPSALVTEVHDSLHADITGMTVPLGTEVHDQATLSDLIDFEEGAINFTLFDNGSCDGNIVSSEEVFFAAGAGPITVETSPEPGLAAGSYSYLASYAGDTNHFGSEAACEPFTIEEEVAEGCTPGFWKQPKHFDSWPGVHTPDTLFSAVFGTVITVGAGGKATITDPTLLQALEATGGGESALARHAVAALLNAEALGDYALEPGDVIALVSAALASGDPAVIEATKDLLEMANEQVCPLS